jgi:hypothetical protein
MFERYGLLGTLSGIAVAYYLFSLIRRRTIRVSDPAAAIRLPSRIDYDRLIFLVFVLEWSALTLFVLAELLPSELATALKPLALSCGATTAILYLLCVMRLRRLGLWDSTHPAEPPHSGSRRRRIRSRSSSLPTSAGGGVMAMVTLSIVPVNLLSPSL